MNLVVYVMQFGFTTRTFDAVGARNSAAGDWSFLPLVFFKRFHVSSIFFIHSLNVSVSLSAVVEVYLIPEGQSVRGQTYIPILEYFMPQVLQVGSAIGNGSYGYGAGGNIGDQGF